MSDFTDYSGEFVEGAEYIGPYYDAPFDWPEPLGEEEQPTDN